jgi:hypothetical protein
MDARALITELISVFLRGDIDRKGLAGRVADELPYDLIEGDASELLPNCEWALRHVNEPEHWTTERELRYYLACLEGEATYSREERDRLLKCGNGN